MRGREGGGRRRGGEQELHLFLLQLGWDLVAGGGENLAFRAFPVFESWGAPRQQSRCGNGLELEFFCLIFFPHFEHEHI